MCGNHLSNLRGIDDPHDLDSFNDGGNIESNSNGDLPNYSNGDQDMPEGMGDLALDDSSPPPDNFVVFKYTLEDQYKRLICSNLTKHLHVNGNIVAIPYCTSQKDGGVYLANNGSNKKFIALNLVKKSEKECGVFAICMHCDKSGVASSQINALQIYFNARRDDKLRLDDEHLSATIRRASMMGFADFNDRCVHAK